MKIDKEPLVTIVTITYNLKKAGREGFFRQCLESVQGQTYGNIEHIIIDGASDDGTLELLKDYESQGLIRYFSEPDKGVYDAMNKGLKAAKGKYIVYLNSDDFYNNKDAVKVSVAALERAEADYSFANTQVLDVLDDRSIGVWTGNINLVPFGIHYCHQSMLTKTSVLKSFGGFDLSYKVSADSDFMIKLIAQDKKYVQLSDCIVSYRSGGISSEHSKQSREDHSSSFYKQIGKKQGLSSKDCYQMWNFSVMLKRNFFYCLYFGKRIKNDDWRREYYRHLFGYDNFRNHIRKYVLLIPWSIRRPLVRYYKKIRRRTK